MIKKAIKDYPELLLLTLTSLITLAYFSLGIDHWKFSFVGDEWPFYLLAHNYITMGYPTDIFSFAGAHGENAVIGSVYQALFLDIFGPSNIAWRMSNIILIIPISFFFYFWLTQVFGKQTALLSTLLLQTSYFLSNYFKIGYINPQALLLLVISLYLATKCGIERKARYFLILGLVMGLGFYIYIGPLIPVIIFPFLLPVFFGKETNSHTSKGTVLIRNLKTNLSSRAFYRNALLLLGGYILLLSPIINAGFDISGPTSKSFLEREFTDSSQIYINIFHNFLLFYKNFDYLYNHFISGAYVDPITQILVLFGTLYSVYMVRKRSYLMLLLSYISCCVIIGFTSPYAYTPTTRGIFFIPFAATFAGIGLSYLLGQMKRYKEIFAVTTISSIFILNLIYSQYIVFQQSGYTTSSLFVKELLTAKAQEDTTPIVLILSSSFAYHPEYFESMKTAYELQEVQFSIIRDFQATCQRIEASKTFILGHDTAMVQKANALPCAMEITTLRGDIQI